MTVEVWVSALDKDRRVNLDVENGLPGGFAASGPVKGSDLWEGHGVEYRRKTKRMVVRTYPEERREGKKGGRDSTRLRECKERTKGANEKVGGHVGRGQVLISRRKYVSGIRRWHGDR